MAKKETKEKLPDNVLVLSNGDKIYFATEFKGKHHLALQQTISTAISSNPVIDDNGKVVSKTEINMKEYQKQVINVFPFLVDKMEDKEGKAIEPSVDYYMEADFDDAAAIYNKTFALITNRREKKNRNKPN